jgi:hypothetical protein
MTDDIPSPPKGVSEQRTAAEKDIFLFFAQVNRRLKIIAHLFLQQKVQSSSRSSNFQQRLFKILKL